MRFQTHARYFIIAGVDDVDAPMCSYGYNLLLHVTIVFDHPFTKPTAAVVFDYFSSEID